MDILTNIIKERLSESTLNLSSYHEELNPDLFDENDKLKPEVRNKIASIVKAFLEYTEVETTVYDVRFIGSNAAYNYTPSSDIDIHIVLDLSSISNPESIARMYMDNSKKLFNETYDIKIKGHDVEVYVEDINTTSISNGVYSVLHDKWIKVPEKPRIPTETELTIASQIKDGIVKEIGNLNTYDEISNFLDQLYLMRKDSLASEGEYGIGNLVFKELRNGGYIKSLSDQLKSMTSQELSLEGKEIFNS